MKKLFLSLIVLLIAVFAALWFREQGGYVFVSVAGWNLEMSLILFVGIVLLVAIAFYAGIGLLRGLWGAPSQVRGWWGERKRGKARRHLISGLIRLAEGRSDEAERLLLKDADRSDAPLLHYLGAAVGAQRRGSYDDRDRYLGQADRTSRRARLAVGLIQAQLQIEAGQWEQALASLNYLQERAPQNPRVLALLMKVCLRLDDWTRLGELLPDLRRHEVIGRDRARELEIEVARRRLQRAQREGSDALDRVWSALARGTREQPEVVLAYAEALNALSRGDEAEKLLRGRLQKDWDERLIACYGRLEPAHPEPAYAQTEKWLKGRPEDPALLEAAGRLAIRSRLWGRAQDYLQAAVARRPRPETYRLLGELHNALGEDDAGREDYYRALTLATGGIRPKELDQVEPPETPEAAPAVPAHRVD